MVRGHIHASATLPTGRNPRYPLSRGQGGLQSRNGRLKEEKTLCHCRVSVHNTSVVKPVATKLQNFN